MKIAYLIELELSSASAIGIINKILHQTRHWTESGHQVKVFFVGQHTGLYQAELTNLDYEILPPEKFKRAFFNLNYVRSSVEKFNPDLIYTRIGFRVYPSHLLLFKKYKTIFEINGNDIEELRKRNPSRLSFFYYKLFRDFAVKSAAGFVSVSSELVSKLSLPEDRTVVILNSIDLKTYRPLAPAKNRHAQLVFIASKDRIWYGIEKLVELATHFPEWTFHIIGDIDIPNRPDNLILHGWMRKNDIENTLKLCDVGISSLALHRIGVNEISPLKTPEYLAYGLPVICAYKDSNFPNGAEFILEIPNTENNIEPSLQSIKDFVEKWKGKRVPREMIKHIDTEELEKKRLSLFEKTIKR